MHWSCVWEIDPAHITDHISRTWQRQRGDKGFVWKVAMTKEHLKKRRNRSPKQMPVCILGPCVVARWWCSRHVITALPRWLLCANRSTTAHSQVGNGCVYYGNKQVLLEPYNTVYSFNINKKLWLDPITHIKFHKITVSPKSIYLKIIVFVLFFKDIHLYYTKVAYKSNSKHQMNEN